MHAAQLSCNVELKASLPSLESAVRLAESLATERLPDQWQLDTYFRCPAGRLKLREINRTSCELIWYQRPDQRLAKTSQYVVAPVEHPAPIKLALSGSLGVLVTVEKHRQIFLYQNVRIHLDQVSGLGCFFELEAVLNSPGEAQQGLQVVQRLRQHFQIEEDALCPVSYSDMRLAQAGPQSSTSSNTSSET